MAETFSPRKRIAGSKENKGYVEEMGTVLETPISFRENRYRVSPRPKPTKPLNMIQNKVSVGKTKSFAILPGKRKYVASRRDAQIDLAVLARYGLTPLRPTL